MRILRVLIEEGEIEPGVLYLVTTINALSDELCTLHSCQGHVYTDGLEVSGYVSVWLSERLWKYVEKHSKEIITENIQRLGARDDCKRQLAYYWRGQIELNSENMSKVTQFFKTLLMKADVAAAATATAII